MVGNVQEWTADWMNTWSHIWNDPQNATFRADPYNQTQRLYNWLDSDEPELWENDPYDGDLPDLPPGAHRDTDDRMAYIGDAPNQYEKSAPWYRGFPSAIFRGGQYPMNFAGVFDMWLGQAVSECDDWLGFRCCMTPR